MNDNDNNDNNADTVRTWVLHNVKTKSELTITLSLDVVLAVTLKGPQGPARRDEKTLKSYSGALAYIEQFIVEREVRGFKLVRDSYQERLRAEFAAKAQAKAEAEARKPAVDPRVADVLAAGAVTRDGWLALASMAPVDDDVIDALLSAHVDTVQLTCDGDGDGDDGDTDGEVPSVRCLRQVLRVPRPRLRSLVLDTHWQTLVRQVDVEYGNRWGELGALLNTQNQLERVYAAGLFSIRTPLKSKGLRELSLISGDLSPALSGLRKSALPALARLGLAGSLEERFDDDVEAAVCTLLASEALPALSHLDVDGARDPVAILEAAAQRPLLSVRVAGALDDEDVVLPRLLKLAAAYQGVDVTLALDTFTEEAAATLLAAWPTLHDGDNHGLFLPQRYADLVDTSGD